MYNIQYNNKITKVVSLQSDNTDSERGRYCMYLPFKSNVITRAELTNRLSRIGISNFEDLAFQSILNHFATSQGYSSFLLEKLEELAKKLDDNKIKKAPLLKELMLETTPNIIAFEKTIEKMISTGIKPDYIMSIFECANFEKSYFKEINYEKISKLLHCRELGMQNKEKLSYNQLPFENEDIDALFFELPHMTINMYDILGENGFVYSFKDKIDNVIDYLVVLGREFSDRNLKDRLILRTNPTITYDYYRLVDEINALKQNYKSCSDANLIKEIENQIATLIRKKNDIIENSIKDPKMILETALIVSTLQSHPDDAREVLNVANPQDKNSCEKYYEILNKKIGLLLGVENFSSNVSEKLNFTKSKSLPRIYAASGEFKRQFKKLIKLLEDNPDKTNLEIFNGLPHNIMTKKEFEKRSLDYDKYVEYNPDAYIELKNQNGEKTGIKVRKADMNDIPRVINLGQDADCCTKVGGRKDFVSIAYLKNKMVSAIEVLDDDVCVGNTMCYFADVDGKTSLLLDNLSFKPRYRNNEIIKDGVFEYAKMLCCQVGQPDMPIYLAGDRHQVEMKNLEFDIKPINLVGVTDKGGVYFDFYGKLTPVKNDCEQKMWSVLAKID